MRNGKYLQCQDNTINDCRINEWLITLNVHHNIVFCFELPQCLTATHCPCKWNLWNESHTHTTNHNLKHIIVHMTMIFTLILTLVLNKMNGKSSSKACRVPSKTGITTAKLGLMDIPFSQDWDVITTVAPNPRQQSAILSSSVATTAWFPSCTCQNKCWGFL